MDTRSDAPADRYGRQLARDAATAAARIHAANEDGQHDEMDGRDDCPACQHATERAALLAALTSPAAVAAGWTNAPTDMVDAATPGGFTSAAEEWQAIANDTADNPYSPAPDGETETIIGIIGARAVVDRPSLLREVRPTADHARGAAAWRDAERASFARWMGRLVTLHTSGRIFPHD